MNRLTMARKAEDPVARLQERARLVQLHNLWSLRVAPGRAPR